MGIMGGWEGVKVKGITGLRIGGGAWLWGINRRLGHRITLLCWNGKGFMDGVSAMNIGR